MNTLKTKGETMQEAIEAILRISKEDRALQTKRNLLKAIPAKKKRLRVNLDKVEKAYDELLAKQKDITRSIKEREALIEVESEKVKITDTRMMEVKNQKEYVALQKEQEGAQKTIKRVEEQILDLEEKQSPLNSELSEIEKELADEKGAYEEAAKEVLEEERKILEMISSYDIMKAELMTKVNPELIKEYETLTNRNVTPAAVEISGCYCAGCAMAIPAQLFNEIIRDGKGVCPHCRRILFYKAPPKPKEEPKPKRKTRAKSSAKSKKKTVKK